MGVKHGPGDRHCHVQYLVFHIIGQCHPGKEANRPPGNIVDIRERPGSCLWMDTVFWVRPPGLDIRIHIQRACHARVFLVPGQLPGAGNSFQLWALDRWMVWAEIADLGVRNYLAPSNILSFLHPGARRLGGYDARDLVINHVPCIPLEKEETGTGFGPYIASRRIIVHSAEHRSDELCSEGL